MAGLLATLAANTIVASCPSGLAASPRHLDMSLPELDNNLYAISAISRSPSRADFVPDEDFPTYSPDRL
jgi:hypothetical protein